MVRIILILINIWWVDFDVMVDPAQGLDSQEISLCLMKNTDFKKNETGEGGNQLHAY